MKRQSINGVVLLAFTAIACGAPEFPGDEGKSGAPQQQALAGYDVTPPLSNAFTIPGPDENGEHHGDVTVVIKATDDLAGVEAIHWALSGAVTGSGVASGSQAWLPIINKRGTTTVTYYAKDKAGNYEGTKTLNVVITEQQQCLTVSLNDFNLFVSGDYTGGHDVRGKVAAGGLLSMEHFSVGAGLPADDLENVLVAGGELRISYGGVFGNAHYGTSTTANKTVTFYRGALSASTDFDFASRYSELEALSDDVAALKVNGTVKRETWGGLYLKGTDPKLNVFRVDASVFTNLRYFSISVPAGSMVFVNVLGDTVGITGFGNGYSGVDAKSVLFNFPEATSISVRSYGFFGTLLAPYADVDFSNGSWDGGLYAASLTGNAEGHIAPLRDFELCGPGGGT